MFKNIPPKTIYVSPFKIANKKGKVNFKRHYSQLHKLPR